MTLAELVAQWRAQASRERADTWGNTEDAPIWRSIHRERGAVFAECADKLEAVVEAERAPVPPPSAMTFYGVESPIAETPLKVAIRAAFDNPTIANIEAVADATKLELEGAAPPPALQHEERDE